MENSSKGKDVKKILLMGNPNVGKSVVFSRLTGVNITSSNYPGTTVDFTRGTTRIRGKSYDLIDAPGVYSLIPTTPAEQVAAKMFEEGDVIVDVVDATNLERNLYLALQILERKKPTIIVLNIWDETKHKGIKIDVEELEKLLHVPVVPTCALTGEGIRELADRLKYARRSKHKKLSEEDRWVDVGKIVKSVQEVKHRHHTLLESIGDLTIKPLTGIPIAIGVLLLSFWVIRMIGEGLIGYVFEPIFELYKPTAMVLSDKLGSGLAHDLLIGKLIEGEIDYTQSMGLLTTGLFVPFAMVLPYIFAFYLMLGLLEDVGYLPRLGVLVDNIMHKLGLHGVGIIPMFLGLGCNVPGELSTRILETKRERFIATTLMAIAVPCMAQIAIIFGLLGMYGVLCISSFFLLLLIIWLVLGIILNTFIHGESPEILLEIPPYRIPHWGTWLKKLWMRVRTFITTAIPFVLLGVFIVNVLYALGIIEVLGDVMAPVLTGMLGLPKDAVAALIIGFLRKDVAVGMLFPIGLTMKQAVIASVILVMYFPCVATFAILVKEVGVKGMIKSTLIMVGLTLLVGTALNFVWV